MVGLNRTFHIDNEKRWTVELEWTEVKVISGSQNKVYRETDPEDLSIRVTNKSWDRCIGFCTKNMSFAEA